MFCCTVTFLHLSMMEVLMLVDVMVKFPMFIGTGYLAFPVLRGAYKEFTIKMEFRPDTHNGLLMYTGEYPNAQLDFFSISLVDGYAQLR